MTDPRPLILTCLLIAASPAVADGDQGKQLHDAHCVDCHARLTGGDGSELYTREDRRVQDMEGLHTQMRLCRDNLGLTWFDDELDAVTQHVNRSWYRFGSD